MDYISGNKTRALYNRNFNDLAADVGNNTLPQWYVFLQALTSSLASCLFLLRRNLLTAGMFLSLLSLLDQLRPRRLANANHAANRLFITPNMVDDGHDSTAAFFSNWTEYFLTPMLKEPKFNSNRTLVLLTFDENDSYTANNQIFTIALGGAVPSNLKNTSEHTYMTHYSTLSSVEANWNLKSLGRGDVNKTMANVIPFWAETFGYQNTEVADADRPQTNITGVAPGPLSDTSYTQFYAPDDIKVIGAGGQPVLVKSGLNTSQTLASLPQTNLTALNQKNPWNTDPGFNNVNVSVAATTAGTSAAKTNAAAKPLIAGTGIAAGAVFAAFSLLL